MANIAHQNELPDSASKQDFYDLIDNSGVTGIVNSDISSGASITDNKLSPITTAGKVNGSTLTSLSSIPMAAGSIPSANIASLPDSSLATISTAGKVDGAALTNLDNIPSDAGDIPLTSLGNVPTPTFSTVAGSYASGSYLIAGPSKLVFASTTGSMTKIIEMLLPRGGTLNIIFGLVRAGSSTSNGQIYRNGSAVGTLRTNATTTYAEYTEDISGWTAGDLLQIYSDDTSGTDGSTVGAMRVYENLPVRETFGTGGLGMGAGLFIFSGNGTPPAALGSVGDLYTNTGGSTSTTLYVKTGSSTWTAK